MLAKRSLALSSSAVLEETILRRESLADTRRVTELLDNARREADAILASAHEQAQWEKDQALAQFWESANEFLHGLEQQRLSLQRESMSAVEELLNAAMSRLLDETTLSERIRALARHLADSQVNENIATLSAHPDQLDGLHQWLQDSRFAEHWQLKGDASMAPESLRLSDANGAFDIDWASLRTGLLGAAPD